MDVNDLDRLFDESFSRLGDHKTPLSNPSSTSPLAADHLLLKRSWDYFRRRMKDIEEHWESILQAKEKEIALYRDETRALKERVAELELESSHFISYEEELKKSKAEDYEKFQHDTLELRRHWEEERESFVRAQSRLEGELRDKEVRFKSLTEEMGRREKRYMDILDKARLESAELVQKYLDEKKEWAEEVTEKEEDIKNLYLKIDVYRAEIDRRDQLIKQVEEESSEKEKRLSAALKDALVLKGELKTKEEDILILKKSMDILSQEKNTIKELWAKEQSEWRELWERERENWERRGPARQENVDSD